MGDVRNRGTRDRPTWYCRYIDTDGKRKERATHQRTKALAQRYVAEIEARIARGEVGIIEPTPEERSRRTITVNELSARFLGDVDGVAGYVSPKLKDIDNYRIEARSIHKVRILPTLGYRAAAAVTMTDVERLRDVQLAGDSEAPGLSAASVVQTLAALSKLYNWARRAKLIDCQNPVVGVERPRPAASIDYLSKTEVVALLKNAAEDAPTVYPMIATAVYAGPRKGELFGMRWIDVDLDAGRIDINRSYRLAPKSGEERHVPINAELAPILRQWRKRCPASAEGLV